ncbi:MAG TPA: tetratricopeptide repeat protein [Longimicrobium sp.]|nr:tetratricopeptide repeat protein [Longimicrobium sp.]
MLHRSFKPPPRRTGRRWCADPALLRDPAFPEPFDGAAVLDEVGGDLGLLLWHTCRDVLLWAAATPDQRTALFVAGSLANLDRLVATVGDAPLRSSLNEVGELLRNGHDERLRITECCEVVADWAVRAELDRTAIAFAQAAAAASPDDAAPFIRAGALLSLYGRDTAAGTWFRRALALARRMGDSASYGNALLALGRLHESKDDVERARRSYRRALTLGRRAGLRTLRAHARHGLMRMAARAGDLETARLHGESALRELGDGHAAALVIHDIAAVMLQQDPHANGATCLAMLRGIVPGRRAGVERISTLVLLVRAAGYAGEVDTLANAWFDAVSAIGRLGESPDAARLLLDLARTGSEAPGIDAAHTQDVARRAFAMAARVNDRAIAEEADTLRKEIWRRVA